MRTEDLIARLARQPVAAPAPPTAPAVLAGFAVALGLLLLALGLRSDLGTALAQPMTGAKTMLPLAAGLTGLLLALRAARPAAAAGAAARAALLLPAMAAALFLVGLASTEPGRRLAVFFGHSVPLCLPSVVILAAPVLVGLMLVLRRGAPVAPVRCGAWAGLAAGGMGAALYSLSCVEDSPLFYVTWYGTGILIVTALGALVGARALRW